MRMDLDELKGLPVVVDLVTAGRAHGMGRTLTYDEYHAGRFPCEVHRRGRYLRVYKADLMRSLHLDMYGQPLDGPGETDSAAGAA
jgi:hypothetical protein